MHSLAQLMVLQGAGQHMAISFAEHFVVFNRLSSSRPCSSSSSPCEKPLGVILGAQHLEQMLARQLLGQLTAFQPLELMTCDLRSNLSRAACRAAHGH